MDKVLNLYKVTLKGMTYSYNGIAHGISYVIAENTDEAYQKVKNFLDKKDIGYSRERELDKVELLASSYEYNNIGNIIYL